MVPGSGGQTAHSQYAGTRVPRGVSLGGQGGYLSKRGQKLPRRAETPGSARGRSPRRLGSRGGAMLPRPRPKPPGPAPDSAAAHARARARATAPGKAAAAAAVAAAGGELGVEARGAGRAGSTAGPRLGRLRRLPLPIALSACRRLRGCTAAQIGPCPGPLLPPSAPGRPRRL